MPQIRESRQRRSGSHSSEESPEQVPHEASRRRSKESEALARDLEDVLSDIDKVLEESQLDPDQFVQRGGE